MTDRDGQHPSHRAVCAGPQDEIMHSLLTCHYHKTCLKTSSSRQSFSKRLEKRHFLGSIQDVQTKPFGKCVPHRTRIIDIVYRRYSGAELLEHAQSRG